MRPTTFPEQNCIIAKDQPQYLPLPAFVDKNTEQGIVVSCWKLTWKERIKCLLFGKIYLQILTFNHPLQPQLPSVDSPFIKIKNDNRS